MALQYIVLGIVLTACVAYAIYRAVKALSVKSGDPCYGCALKDACQKYNKRKEPCEDRVTASRSSSPSA